MAECTEAGRRGPRRAVGAAPIALLAVVCTLAACGAMPDEGPAGPGRDRVERGPEPLRVAAVGPRPGAGPAEIVGGFLHAGASSEDDQAVARSFLVGTAATSWQRNRGVVVYPDDTSLKVTVSGSASPVRVHVTAPVQASIDAEGRYLASRRGTRAHAVFTLVQDDDRWRVSEVESTFGAWLPTYDLDRTFSALPVTFVAAGSPDLVPDLRWFTGPRRGLATALVRTLLQGPPAYLGGAVVTGFPPGTALAVDAVPTTDGIAQVDLTAQALTASPAMRRMMWAQLITTLRRLPSVAEVRLTAAGAPFEVPGVTSTSVYTDTAFRDDVRVTGTPVVLTGDRLAPVDPVSGKLSKQTTALPGAGLMRSVGVGPGGSLVVGVHTSRRQLLRLQPAKAPVVLLTGNDLVDPVVDRTGAVWTAGGSALGRLIVVPAAGATGNGVTGAVAAGARAASAPTTMAPPWLRARRVRAIDVSRDGARAVVVSEGTDGFERVDVAGVVRDEGGAPTSLAAALQVGRGITDVVDVAWADRTALVVLGASARGAARTPYEVVVGGTATALPPVAGAIAVAAGDGLRAVYLTTAAGTVLARAGARWSPVGAGRSVSIPE